MNADRFTIELADIGGATPAAVRLRRLLEIGLRQLGLKAVGVRETQGERSGEVTDKLNQNPIETRTPHEGKRF